MPFAVSIRGLLSKKILGIAGILVFFSLGAGFFYYWQFYETPPEKWDNAKYSKAEDYDVQETAEGVKVVNKKAGLSFMVPEGWRVEKKETYIELKSSDLERESFVFKKGCFIGVDVASIKTSFGTIEKALREKHQSQEWGYKDEYRVMGISGKISLQNETGITRFGQYYLNNYILRKTPLSNLFISIGLASSINEGARCKDAFNGFLEKVSID